VKKTRVLLSKQDWVEAAIQELSVSGFDGVAVEPLARRLGISKGSFYWHFRDLSELVAAVLETWKTRAVSNVIGELDSIGDPRRRIAALIQTAWADPSLLRAEGALMSAGVAGDELVVPAVREVITLRLEYLRDLYLAMGVSPSQADRWALTAYTAYAGLVQLVTLRAGCLCNETEIRALAAHVESVLIPAKVSPAGARRRSPKTSPT
jgi:AcrR family transcriptional regulator